MRTAFGFLCVALLAGLLAGCGSEADRGANRDRDMPRSADKPAE